MVTLVQKFGGTSVASIAHMHRAVERVGEAKARGNSPVVVVSAMGRTTNQLVSLWQEHGHPIPLDSEYDALLATGENLSAALFASVLNQRGYPAQSYAAWQVPIHTNDHYGESAILDIDTRALQHQIDQNVIPVVAGFQGVNSKNRLTTLGRGGSDITAVALARALQTPVCDIYTDVAGVYRCDPNRIANSELLSHIGYEEMLEFAVAGAKVMHARGVYLAMRAGITLHVRHFGSAHSGTLIGIIEATSMENKPITGLAYSLPKTLFWLDYSSFSAVESLLRQANSQSIATELTLLPPSHCLFSCLSKDAAHCTTLLQQQGIAIVQQEHGLVTVSAIGMQMKDKPDIIARILQNVTAHVQHLHHFTTTEMRASATIPSNDVEAVLRALHREFELHDEVSPCA